MNKFLFVIFSVITVSIGCFDLSGMTCNDFIKENSAIYGYVNYRKIKNTNSYLWISEYLKKVLNSKDIEKSYSLLNNINESKNTSDIIDNVYFSIKKNKNLYSLNFILKLNKKFSYRKIKEMIHSILSQSQFSNSYSIAEVNENNVNSEVLQIKLNSKSEEFHLMRGKNGLYLFAGDSSFIQFLNKEKEIIIDSCDKDIELDFSIPENIRRKIAEYSNKLKNDKNAIPLELQFFDGLKKIKTEALFKKYLTINSVIYFENEKYLSKCNEFAEQIIPLLKFQLLSFAKIKSLTLVKSLKTKENKAKNTFNISFTVTDKDIKNLSE